MSKVRSLWIVFFDAVKIYFTNIDKFFLYMLFPVFGQVLGIALTFGMTLSLMPKIAQKTSSISMSLIFLFLLALPGLLIFMKAFWDYVVAYIALNSMTEGIMTSGKLYDIQSHRQVATNRAFKYILFLSIVGILILIGSSIFFIIPGFVLWIYLILVFQIFTFEQDLGIKDCFKRSFNLVKGRWSQTFLLMFLLSLFSIFLITEGVSVIFDYMHLTDNLCSLFDFIGNSIDLTTINKALMYLHQPEITTRVISQWMFYIILWSIVSGMTLPIRSICWTLWYKNLSEAKVISNKKGKFQ